MKVKQKAVVRRMREREAYSYIRIGEEKAFEREKKCNYISIYRGYVDIHIIREEKIAFIYLQRGTFFGFYCKDH